MTDREYAKVALDRVIKKPANESQAFFEKKLKYFLEQYWHRKARRSQLVFNRLKASFRYATFAFKAVACKS